MSKSWEQILSGYATDTLTEEEKRQLFEAALQDQTLFDALADEEALKALLADPEARQRILACLQTSGEPKGGASSSRSGLSWFRQPSSLAWAGSIAAMGLALIFGWQMEKDWGPLVQEEQEAERSVSEDKDEVAFQSQPPKIVNMKEQTQDIQKKDQMEPERVAGLSAPAPIPQPPIIAKASKGTDRLRQSPAKVPSERVLRPEVKKEHRLKAKELAKSAPESAIVQNVPEEELMSAPSEASPKAKEKGRQQLAQAPSFADRRRGGDATSSLSVRELFYANKSRRVDGVGEELDGMRAQQLLGGLSSKTEKALTEDDQDLKKSQEVVQDDAQGQARGIRYSFVRRAVDGEDETIDITKFSGKWSDLQLAIESNVSGYLYVLTSFGKGKWQWVKPESGNISVLSDGAIKVNDYQPVHFALSQVTNTLGKPVVSSIIVLLASTSLTDLGKWLGQGVGAQPSEGRLTEHSAAQNFVIAPSLEPGTPLRVNISLEN